ncbi:MAG: ribosome small subunit-dependent GTPase A [Burkholderiales bacterium]|nr:ribosome small subunit-dependent GTPase A [Burkholderiales bacterium]
MTTQAGLVVAAQRRHFDVLLDNGARAACLVRGRRLRIAVGDRVDIEGGAIVAVAPRKNLVWRSDAFKEKLVAANVSQIAAVVAPDLGVDEDLVSRWTIAAEAAGARFVVLANKSDQSGFDGLRERLRPYEALGYAVVPLSATRDASPALPWLRAQHTVLVGQSGMGKSTLINALVPGAGARTTPVSAALGAGRHTTTSTTLYPLDGASWIVDSPGMKVFGLAHIDPVELAHAFVEMRPYLGHCRFRDCRHAAEPDCAVTAAVDKGAIAPHRLALLHTLAVEAAAGRR